MSKTSNDSLSITNAFAIHNADYLAFYNVIMDGSMEGKFQVLIDMWSTIQNSFDITKTTFLTSPKHALEELYIH